MSTALRISTQLAALSRWVDDGQPADRDPEAVTWGRLAKVSEEQGEVIAAFIGATGQNPRKGLTHTRGEVIKELLDVAVTALAAVEHMVGNSEQALRLFADHLDQVCARAGIEVHPRW
jgi:hypothetical protein